MTSYFNIAPIKNSFQGIQNKVIEKCNQVDWQHVAFKAMQITTLTVLTAAFIGVNVYLITCNPQLPIQFRIHDIAIGTFNIMFIGMMMGWKTSSILSA